MPSGRVVSRAEALNFLHTVTGRNFTGLSDPAISSALRGANLASGAGGGGSCVYVADGERVCHDGITQEQCENGLGGRWSGVLTCEFRGTELGEVLTPISPMELTAAVPAPMEAVPPTTPTRRAAKPAKKKPAKKRAAPRAAKRATAAARTKPKKKAAGKAKPKRRAVKAAAKKTPKRTAKKAKRRR